MALLMAGAKVTSSFAGVPAAPVDPILRSPEELAARDNAKKAAWAREAAAANALPSARAGDDPNFPSEAVSRIHSEAYNFAWGLKSDGTPRVSAHGKDLIYKGYDPATGTSYFEAGRDVMAYKRSAMAEPQLVDGGLPSGLVMPSVGGAKAMKRATNEQPASPLTTLPLRPVVEGKLERINASGQNAVVMYQGKTIPVTRPSIPALDAVWQSLVAQGGQGMWLGTSSGVASPKNILVFDVLPDGHLKAAPETMSVDELAAYTYQRGFALDKNNTSALVQRASAQVNH